MSENIDFVITWVDGNDEKWQQSKNSYSNNINKKINSKSRYRDWEILKYWFRSVERHASWVNKIFFITEGHLPAWLNTEHEKLVIIKHSDFIEEKYLPTFNSNVIELSICNIEELSEQFVNFNDDMFLNKDVTPDDFFINKIPRDSGVFSPIVPKSNTIDNTVLNNVEIINDNFNRKKILEKHFLKFFNVRYGKHLIKNFCVLPWSRILGFYDNHIPISYNKSIYSKVIREQKNVVDKTLTNKFRTKEDINHWLIRYWQICLGNFVPRSTTFGTYYDIGIDQKALLTDIRKSKHKMICINDNDLLDDFNTCKYELINEFERKYGKKSAYEK